MTDIVMPDTTLVVAYTALTVGVAVVCRARGWLL